MHVTAFGPEQRMRRMGDGEIQIAHRSASHPAGALSAQADALAFGDPSGDLHAQGSAVVEGNGTSGAVVGVLERDLDLRIPIPAPGSRRPAPALQSTGADALPEQRLEEVAEAGGAGEFAAESAAAEVEPPLPSRGRPELLAVLPVLAEPIVGGPLPGVLQDLVGLADLLEARLGVRLLRDVGMVLAGETPVRALDVVRRRLARDPERFVVVLETHLATSPSRYSGRRRNRRRVSQRAASSAAMRSSSGGWLRNRRAKPPAVRPEMPNAAISLGSSGSSP